MGDVPVQRVLRTEEIVRALDARRDLLTCAYLFGSAARGEAGPLSDVDIAVLFNPGVDPDARVECAAGIVSDLQYVDGPRIDVTILNDAPASVAHRVIRDGRLLLSRDERQRVTFEARTIREYLDFEPLLARYDRIMLARLKAQPRDRRS